MNTQNCGHYLSIFPYITEEWKSFFKSLKSRKCMINTARACVTMILCLTFSWDGKPFLLGVHKRLPYLFLALEGLPLPPLSGRGIKKGHSRPKGSKCMYLLGIKFKHVDTKCYPAPLLHRNISLLMQLERCFFAFSSLWTRALVDIGREQAKHVVRNGKKDTTTCLFVGPLDG